MLAVLLACFGSARKGPLRVCCVAGVLSAAAMAGTLQCDCALVSTHACVQGGFFVPTRGCCGVCCSCGSLSFGCHFFMNVPKVAARMGLLCTAVCVQCLLDMVAHCGTGSYLALLCCLLSV
jgi:hypothetical protein